jgi:hypothetical protein
MYCDTGTDSKPATAPNPMARGAEAFRVPGGGGQLLKPEIAAPAPASEDAR